MLQALVPSRAGSGKPVSFIYRRFIYLFRLSVFEIWVPEFGECYLSSLLGTNFEYAKSAWRLDQDIRPPWINLENNTV
jgi:hypothetical protein